MSAHETLKKRGDRELIHENVKGGRLSLDSILPKLKELFNRHEEVEAAILFGSIARNRTSAHDIDIALKLAKEDLLDVGYIASQISKTLNVSEERVDVIILDQSNPILLSC